MDKLPMWINPHLDIVNKTKQGCDKYCVQIIILPANNFSALGYDYLPNLLHSFGRSQRIINRFHHGQFMLMLTTHAIR